ncbi:MAG: glutamine--tRNA ligase/YqeY domain fusion protein, partial [Deinococcus sp.]
PNFITDVVEADLQAGRVRPVVTRFPPEPNGYMHLGHAFATFLDFGVAQDHGGRCHLRMDDTNPEAESMEFALGLQEDVRWLGWDWGPHLYFASDRFEDYYQAAERLIELGAAYVDSVPQEEMRRLRGTAYAPGTPSPYRERSVEENLDLFRRMRAGEFPEEAHVLRAKIDLASPNMKLRDPVLYRILRAHHYRQGNGWCIYPMYDFQHPLQDAFEGVTHSLCSLEYVDNRAIYAWLMERLYPDAARPHQYEFGRRSLEYTIVSKRKLRRLVEGGFVTGWDDPRMPTIVAQRRRGVTPQAIRTFAAGIGVSRTNRTVDLAVYENAVRGDLNHHSPRVMAVLDPLRLVIGNLEEERHLDLPYWPHDVVEASPDGLLGLPGGERVPPQQATRPVPLGRELYIERADFEVEPPQGFKRLTPGGRVRLRGAGIVQAERFELGPDGRVSTVYASLQPEEGRAGGVIHWVDVRSAVPAEFRLYDRLFLVPHPEEATPEDEAAPGPEGDEPPEADFLRHLNPESLRALRGYVEESVGHDPPDTRYQFERQGYFWQDPHDSRPGALVFSRIVTLRDTWSGREPGEAARTPAEEKAHKPRPAKAAAPPAAAPASQLTSEQSRVQEELIRLGVSEGDRAAILRDRPLQDYLSGLTGPHAGTAASLAVSVLAPALREGEARVTLEALTQLASLVAGGQVSARSAREVLAEAQASGETPVGIVERLGLRQVSDPAQLEALIRQVMAEQPAKLAEYRAGKRGLTGFFAGQVMRLSQGQANPQRLAELLERLLAAG